MFNVYEVYTWDDVNYSRIASFDNLEEAEALKLKLSEERKNIFVPDSFCKSDPVCYTVMSDLQYYLLMNPSSDD